MAPKKTILNLLLISAVLGFVIWLAGGRSGGTVNAVIQTTKGDIELELYPKKAPRTVEHFTALARDRFYDGVRFHRVVKDFMIQGGDPTGTGMGGPGYTIKDEFTHAGGNKNNRGTISMANSGPNTGGSQFFINLVDNNFLDGKHPAFGRVVAGMDVVDKIAVVSTDASDRPATEVNIIRAQVVEI